MVKELLQEVWVVDLFLKALKEELEDHDLVGQEAQLGLLLVRELSVPGLSVLVLLAQVAWVPVELVQQPEG